MAKMVRETKLKNNKKQKILDVVLECNILRLKPHEALDLIQKETGIKISDRTYRRYKNEIVKGIDDRLEYLARTEVISEHIQSIDMYKKIERELWKNYDATDSIPTKKSILDSIGKSHIDMANYYNHANVITGLKGWFDIQLKKLDDKRNSTMPDTPTPIQKWPTKVPSKKGR